MRVSVSNEYSVKNKLFKRLCVSLSARSVTLFDCRMTASGFSGKLTFKNTKTEFNFDIFGSDLVFSVDDTTDETFMSDGKFMTESQYNDMVDFIVKIVNEMENASADQLQAAHAVETLPLVEQSSDVIGTLRSIGRRSSFAMMLVRLLNIVQGKEKLDNDTLELIRDVVDFLNQRI